MLGERFSKWLVPCIWRAFILWRRGVFPKRLKNFSIPSTPHQLLTSHTLHRTLAVLPLPFRAIEPPEREPKGQREKKEKEKRQWVKFHVNILQLFLLNKQNKIKKQKKNTFEGSQNTWQSELDQPDHIWLIQLGLHIWLAMWCNLSQVWKQSVQFGHIWKKEICSTSWKVTQFLLFLLSRTARKRATDKCFLCKGQMRAAPLFLEGTLSPISSKIWYNK